MTDTAVDVDFDSKYGHLTKPLKEAALCWDINLEDVIGTFLSSENDDSVSMDPSHMMNFAQAGMLVSSTAFNYGRKVEHLYTLVYSTLDSLSKGEGKSLATSTLMKKMRKRIVGFQEFENGFELLDEQFRQPARNIDLAVGEGLSNGSHITRRVPLLLLPREDSAEKAGKEQQSSAQKQSSNGTDFKTSGCYVSKSGCLLLDPQFSIYEDWDKLGQGGRGSMGGRASLKGPLVPGAISAVDSVVEINEAIMPVPSPLEDFMATGGPPSPDFSPSMEAVAEEDLPSPLGLFPPLPEPDLRAPGKRARSLEGQADLLPSTVDFFKELDPHSVSTGRSIKMKVGKCHKTPPELKTVMELSSSLDRLNVFNSKNDLFGLNSDLLAESVPVKDPSDNLLPLVNSSPLSLFKGLFELELRELKKKAAKAALERKKEEAKKQRNEAVVSSDESDDNEETSTPDNRRFSIFSSRQSLASVAEARPLSEVELSKGDKALQLERQRTALLEKVLESSKRDYDELMRRNLFEMNSSVPMNNERTAEGGDSLVVSSTISNTLSNPSVQERVLPELYANIRKWQDNLEPLLEEQSSHPVFDLDDYLVSIIGKLKEAAPVVVPAEEEDESSAAISEFLKNAGVEDMSDDDMHEDVQTSLQKKGQISSFESLVKGEPKWNVCRLFLSTLILTNNGNVEIFNQEQSEPSSSSPTKRSPAVPASPLTSRKDLNGSSPLRGSHTFGASQSFQVKLRNADKNFKFAIQDNAAVVTGIPILTNKDVPAPEPLGDVPFVE
jgi:hypothetical protein